MPKRGIPRLVWLGFAAPARLMPGAMYVRRAMTEGMKGSDFLPSREPGRLPGTGVPAFHPEDEFGGGRGFEKTFEASSRPFGLLSPEGG